MYYGWKEEVRRMNEKLYRVDQFYPGDFAQILTGVYSSIQLHCHGESDKAETKKGNNGYCHLTNNWTPYISFDNLISYSGNIFVIVSVSILILSGLIPSMLE